ncbi:hypothetical protein NPIL_441561 [Nephila pilipes]|uniref:Uncharacterized protein n=1 Tax=Nephila pilipes TaxID=299642 RepID=A0A8X6T8E3_NEPPI|nr:hypothetical protein NPIL_441561 [Nephila pilipes]
MNNPCLNFPNRKHFRPLCFLIACLGGLTSATVPNIFNRAQTIGHPTQESLSHKTKPRCLTRIINRTERRG